MSKFTTSEDDIETASKDICIFQREMLRTTNELTNFIFDYKECTFKKSADKLVLGSLRIRERHYRTIIISDRTTMCLVALLEIWKSGPLVIWKSGPLMD